MTYKQIETAREVRLWLGQVIVPAAVLVMAFPEVRLPVVRKINVMKNNIRSKFKKEEES